MTKKKCETRRRPEDEVFGLKMEPIQRSVRWTGLVRLHMLNEDDESLLNELRWPPRTGPVYWVCASTGLLFDKQSGCCVQSSRVTLLLDTVAPIENADEKTFKEWRKKRIADLAEFNHDAVSSKRGPKSKEQKEYLASLSSEGEDEGDCETSIQPGDVYVENE